MQRRNELVLPRHAGKTHARVVIVVPCSQRELAFRDAAVLVLEEVVNQSAHRQAVRPGAWGPSGLKIVAFFQILIQGGAGIGPELVDLLVDLLHPLAARMPGQREGGVRPLWLLGFSHGNVLSEIQQCSAGCGNGCGMIC
jgi:hypothetical protein